nr:hypothetical protein [uncultured Carboxylicivirga sp.]
MNKKYIISVLLLAMLILVAMLAKSKNELNERNTFINDIAAELDYYKIKSKADSLLNHDELELALEQFAILDQINNNEAYTHHANSIFEERNKTHQNNSFLSNKIRERGKVIRQLYKNKDELNDSLEKVKTTLYVLQTEFDSVLICNSNIELRVNELNDSISSIHITDTLTIYCGQGVSIKYLGEVKSGKAHGFGYAIFDNKGFYEGNWKNSLRNGQGKYSWQNGDVYEGEYSNDLRNGFGIYQFKSGEQYIGDWRNDLRHGKGVLLDKDTKVLFDGKWENDKPDRH